ncbi:translation initiation factor IF-2, partial [Microbispora triticiradicis]
MAKVRVYELAKEFGVESKVVMAKLTEMGEFVRSASSTIEAPVVRKLTEAFKGDASKGGGRPARPAQPKPAPRPASESQVNGGAPQAPVSQSGDTVARPGPKPGPRPAPRPVPMPHPPVSQPEAARPETRPEATRPQGPRPDAPRPAASGPASGPASGQRPGGAGAPKPGPRPAPAPRPGGA